nr:unnamed protein product [Spirometra erinaceieuropaei]
MRSDLPHSGPASCRPFIQSSWLASPQMDRPLSEGVPQPPPPPPPTVRCPFTRPWRGSRRGRGYTRSASYSMRSLEDSPASDFGPPPPPLPLDHPPWQKLAPPSAEAWGRARSLQVDASVSTSTSVPASPLEGRHASHLLGNVTRRGLWMKCYQPNRTCHAILPFISAKDGWQGGAVCILLAAIGLGLLGIGLSVVGYSGSDLLKRLYYFHSGGEIFFLAGFTTFLSLGIYRSYAQSNLVNAATGDVELTFGAADTVGWVAGVLYFITAFCLLMDEFIHEMAKMSTRWPCLGVLLRFGALQIARLSRWRHACSLRWRRCCKRGRRQKRLSRVPMSSTSATATHSSSFGLLETAYRPTTGQLISKKRGRRS